LNNKLIENLISNKDKIIFHCTCTGFGGTVIEPNVPEVESTHKQVQKLITEGFPTQQVTLRVDPIIPTEKGLQTVCNVLDMFKDTGIKRVRYSFLDLYPHVKERFTKADIPLPYNSFTTPKYMINNTLRLLDKYEDTYEFESCAETTKHQTGCISQKDLDILGIDEKIETGGFQRVGCMCATGKTELLNSKKQCSHGCIYCYWRN
jgi:DNA repair photolyase